MVVSGERAVGGLAGGEKMTNSDNPGPQGDKLRRISAGNP